MRTRRKPLFKRINYTTLTLLIAFVVFSILFNNMVINIRLQEANYHLHKVSQNQFAQNTFLISSKYALIKKRITSGENEMDNLIFEVQMQAILSGDESKITESSYKPLPKYHPATLILNSLRSILGKEKLQLSQNSHELNRELELSLFLQRNRNYERAIETYDNILLNEELDKDLRTSILLQKAFCISMLGRLSEAAEMYNAIHKAYPTSENGIISKEMRDFVYSLIEQNKRLMESKESEFARGKQLYYNINYKAALPFIENEIDKTDPETIAEARFFKGRILEEMGLYRQATKEYHKIMYLSADNEWCRAANRRLTLLGTVYKQRHPLLESAKSNLSQMKDTAFLTKVETMEKIVEEPKKDELESSFLNEPIFPDDTTLLNLAIKSEFEALPDSKKVEPKKKNEEPKKKRPINEIKPKKKKRELTKAEKLERARKLANSPYRKASFIRTSINAKTPKLQKIYLDFVNSGEEVNGEILIKMKIASSGKIEASIAKTDIKNRRFNKKILREVNRWKFPAIDEELGTLTISYPFTFKK